MSHMVTTVFDFICLGTGDTKHLYYAYTQASWLKPTWYNYYLYVIIL